MFNGVATQSEQIPSSFQANSKSFQVPSKSKHKMDFKFNPDAKPDMLDKRIDYAFKTNLWKYVINPRLYDEIEGDDDGYSSDATEYCQVRGGVRCIMPAAGSEAIHRLVVNLFKNDDWMKIVFDVSPPKDL